MTLENRPSKIENRKRVIGLVGAPGSGKSFVAEEFARHEARIISGDQLGHEALRQPDIREHVVERWGQQVLGRDGEIDRRRLGASVFADVAERRALEALVFPWIERRIGEEIARAVEDPEVRCVVLDAAIMLETGWDKICDRIVYVDAPQEVRRQRLAEQRGWTEEEVAVRENAQMPLQEKMRRADFVVNNSGTREQIAKQVEDLLLRMSP